MHVFSLSIFRCFHDATDLRWPDLVSACLRHDDDDFGPRVALLMKVNVGLSFRTDSLSESHLSTTTPFIRLHSACAHFLEPVVSPSTPPGGV